MNKPHRITTTVPFALSLVASAATGVARDRPGDRFFPGRGRRRARPAPTWSRPRGPYTVLDHPSRPCHLSEEAVANWGETSAHLPQACTYGDDSSDGTRTSPRVSSSPQAPAIPADQCRRHPSRVGLGPPTRRFHHVQAAHHPRARVRSSRRRVRSRRQPGSAHNYTTLDHPALPCNLSEEAVANWGETSAHLPLACTYDE